MNKFVIFFITITVILFGSFGPLSSQEISLKEKAFVLKISQTIHSLKNRSNTIWKNYNLSDTPVIVSFSNEHIYAFNLKSNNPAWKILDETETETLFSDTDPWGINKITMQDKFIVDGTETFVFRIDENENNGFADRPVLVLVHELFHRYQFANFKKSDDVGRYEDQSNIENLSMIELEERILIDFLKVPKNEKLEALKNFMAVNQARNQIISKASIKWERFQQVMEGLADYAATETFDTFPIIEKFDGEKHLQILLSGYIYSEDPQELAVKWRHYGVGAALGKALDFLKVSGWKDRVELGESQGSILEKSIVLSNTEIKKRLAQLKNRYKYTELKQNIEKKVNGFREMMEDLRLDYEAQDGFVVLIEKPYEISINGGGSTCGIFHLDYGMTVSVKDKSFSSSTDNTWKIELKEIPFLLQNRDGSRILKVDHELNMLLDGKAVSIQDLKSSKKERPFKTLSWDCQTSSFESVEREGHIICDDEGLSIIYNH